MGDTAKELKEKGNQFYKQEKFAEALKCYSEASSLQPNEPVFHSNISAVQFELGQYKEAIQTIEHALSIISSSSSSSSSLSSSSSSSSFCSSSFSSNPQLTSRLLLRKAKCLFYSSYSHSQLLSLSETLSSISSLCKEFNIPNPDVDGGLEKAVANPKLEGEYPKLSIFRSTPDTRTPEYYIVGHDRPTSSFAGYLTNDQITALREVPQAEFTKKFREFFDAATLRILLCETSQTEFAFLFGGIGDARHLFASLIDIFESLENSTADENSAKEKKKFHFTMVDVKEAVIARDLVLFYILKHLADFDNDKLETDLPSVQLLALLTYTYFSSVIPEYLYSILLNFIQELINDLEEKNLPSWIVVDESSIPGILLYLKDWLDVKVTTQSMLKRTNSQAADRMNNMITNEVKKTNLPANFEDPASTVKQYMSQMSDEELMKLPIPGATLAEKKESLKMFLNNANMDNLARESSILLPGLKAEHTTYRHLNTIYPPDLLMEKHPKIKELMEVVEEAIREQTKPKEVKQENENNENSTETESQEPAKKEREEKPEGYYTNRAIAHIEKKFRPNPTFWDKWWVEVVGVSTFEFSNSIFNAVGNICETSEIPSKPRRIYDYMAPFFARLAKSISKFSKNSNGDHFVLEWIVGDVYSVCNDIDTNKETRKEKGLAVSYDRIFLSNIPDYAGGNLPIAIFCAPLLKSSPHSYLGYNVLLNTGVFKNYNECVQTYTLLPSIADHEKFLAMKHIHGDLWGEDPKWIVSPSPLPPHKLASQEELTVWLYRVFLYIVLPPQRSGMSTLRVDHPLNLLSFVNLVKRLATIGYPHHWLAGILDSLLSGKIKTKSRPPPNSMNIHYSPAMISTKPFVAELEYAVATNLSLLPFSLLSPLPSSFREVSFQTQFPERADSRACVVSLFFSSKKDMATTSVYKNLRDTIVAGNPDVMLLSVLQWNSQEGKIKFFMEKEKIQKMVDDDWFVLPVRLDNYINLCFQPARLKDIIVN